MDIRNDTASSLDLSSGAKQCQYLKVLTQYLILFTVLCENSILRQTEIYLLFFSLLRLINAMINSVIPAHSHIIPIAVFSAQNQAGERTIHIIAKIKIPLLLIIIPPKNSNFPIYFVSSQNQDSSIH